MCRGVQAAGGTDVSGEGAPDGPAAGTVPPAASAAPATGKSNWERLKASALEQSDAVERRVRKPRPLKRPRSTAAAAPGPADVHAVSSDGVHGGRLVPKSADASDTAVVALDCEMVGVGNLEVKAKGRDALARVCVVRPHAWPHA